MSKKKSYSIGALSLSVIGSALIGLLFSGFLVFTIGVAENVFWQFTVQTICLIIYIAIIYSPVWYCGDRDANSVAFNRIKYDSLKGLKIGLIAVIPFFLIWLLAVIFWAMAGSGASGADTRLFVMMIIYRMSNVHIIGFINLIINPETQAINYKLTELLTVGLFNIIIPAVSTVAYLLGYKHISLTDKLVFKKKKRA